MSENHASPQPTPQPFCSIYARLLPMLHMGLLSAEEQADVEAHLAECAWCQNQLATYDVLDAALLRQFAGEAHTSVASPAATSRMRERPLHSLEDIMKADQQEKTTAARQQAESTRALSLVRNKQLTALGALAAAVVLVLLAGVLFASHRLGSGGTPGGPPTANLAHTSWTLAHLVVDGREQPLVAGHAPTLDFGPHDGQIEGTGGCNGYMAVYTLDGDTLHVSAPASLTQPYCKATGVMEQQNTYFQALQRVERYRLAGSTLTLTSADGSVTLTFVATS